MAIIDTTEVVESSMFLKAKLKKNMVGDNYYLQSLQSKVDAEWDYRYNVVDIEEEPEKQTKYTKEKPKYVPIETVVQHVKSDKGIDLSEDWLKLVFRNIKHPTVIGKRYRFSLDFEKNPTYTEEEKERECSIWLSINMDVVTATSGVVVRKCNSNLMFAGSPTMSVNDITEYHCEPCVLEDDFKYINVYMNSVVNINQAEIYAIMQYNYFTQNIKLNDRLVIGAVDLDNRDNNSVFKVKAIRKFTGEKTFRIGEQEDMGTIPLVIIAMDRDVISEKDDFNHRISNQPPLYKVEGGQTIVEPPVNPEPTPEKPPIILNNYEIVVDNAENTSILLGEEETYKYRLLRNGEVEEAEIVCEAKIFGTEKDRKYFDFKQEGNKITILNKRPCLTNKLVLSFSCVTSNGEKCSRELLITLGGNY